MANNTIEGINIRFGADTADFNKGLGQINKDLNATAKLGKELDKALKIDPTNLKLLNKSLETTQQELAGSEEKSKALNTELKRLKALNVNDLNKSLEITAKELDDSKNSTKELTKELKAMEKAGQIDTDEFKKLSEELEKSKNNTKNLTAELKTINKDIKAIEITNITKLETELLKAETNTTNLDNKTKQLANDIRAIDTKNYKDLSDSTKRAAKSTGDLTDEQLGYNEALSNPAPSQFNETLTEGVGKINLFGFGVSNATKLLNPWTAALAVGTGALLVFNQEANIQSEVQRELAKNLNGSTVALTEQEVIARTLSKTMGIELSESLAIVSEGQRLYGDSVRTSDDLIKASLVALGLRETGMLTLEESQASLTTSQDLFNLSVEESTGVLANQVKIMQKYGKKADDINDTYIEFGDTFTTLGGDADEFFRILETGLIMGSRNTDEVGNAYNEYLLRVQKGTPQIQESFKKVGVSFEETQDAINAGDFEAVNKSIVDVITGLSEIDNSTAVSAEIFGTYGEEFVATFASNKDSVAALNGALAQNQTQLKLTEGTTKAFTEILNSSKESGEITTQQYNLMSKAIEDNDTKTLLLWATMNDKLIPVLSEFKEQGLITEDQMKTMGESATVLKDLYVENGKAGLFTAVASGLFGKALKFATDKNLLSQEQNKNLTESYGILKTATDLTADSTNGLNTNQTKLNEQLNNLINDNINLTTTTSSYNSVLGGTVTQTKTLDLANLSLKEKLDLVNKEMIKSPENQKKLVESYKILTDSTKSYQDKTEAASIANKILGDEGIISAKKQAEQAAQISKLSDTLAGETGGLQQDFLKVSKSQATNTETAENYNKELRNSVRDLDKMKGRLEKTKSEMFNFGKETQKATNAVKDLNKQIDAYNNKPMSPKSAGVNVPNSSKSSSFSLPPTPQINAIPMTTNNITPTTHQTKNNSITLNISGSLNKAEAAMTVDTINRELGRLKL